MSLEHEPEPDPHGDDIDAPDDPVHGAEDLPDEVKSGNALAGEDDADAGAAGEEV